MPTPPTYPGVYIDERPSGVRTITGVPTSVTAFIGGFERGPVGVAVSVHGYGAFIRTFGGGYDHDITARVVRSFFENGGGRAWIVRVGTEDADGADSPDGRAPDAAALAGGLAALETVDTVNIICVPQTGAALLDEASIPGLVERIEDFCERHRAMYIHDLPYASAQSAEAALAWLDAPTTTRHENTVAYFPQIVVADPRIENGTRSIPPSGAMAGLWARTDVERGVWKAPAGLDASLGDARSLDVTLSNDQAELLNKAGLNCIRRFPRMGTVAWGSRTRAGSALHASEWKYVPVRRLALHIEESVHRGTQWVVFEPNDEPLWSKLRLSVGAFMNSLFRQGAFQGSTPRDAYFIKCDAETTTQDDINMGIVNIVVGFAPLKPAEFVVLRMGQRAQAKRRPRRQPDAT